MADPAPPLAPNRDEPYVPFYQPFRSMRQFTSARTMGSPNTVPIWLLALLPLMLIPVQLLAYFTGLSTTNAGSAGVGLGAVALLICFALLDRVALRRRNVEPASGWWLLLLLPLGYLIARRIVLKRQGVKSNAPGNAYVLSTVGAYLLVVLVLLPSTGASVDPAAIHRFESEAESQLQAESSTPWTVDCPDDAPVLTPGSNFQCTATTSGGRALSFRVDVNQQGKLVIGAVRSTGAEDS